VGKLFDFFGLFDHVHGERVFTALVDILLELIGEFEEFVGVALNGHLAFMIGTLGHVTFGLGASLIVIGGQWWAGDLRRLRGALALGQQRLRRNESETERAPDEDFGEHIPPQWARDVFRISQLDGRPKAIGQIIGQIEKAFSMLSPSLPMKDCRASRYNPDK
jgi:hypothetical protein